MSSNKQRPQLGTSLMQSAKEGFGLGLGVGLAQRAISAIFGAPEVKMVSREPTEYEQCLIEKRDIGICAHLLKKE